MKKAMERYCYSLDQDKIIEEICKHCHLCQSLIKIPKDIPIFQPSSPPEHPGTHWAADVMKYGKRCILVGTDNLSSFSVATIARSERYDHLQEAIISAILPFKSMAVQTEVRVDTAPGLAKLTRSGSLAKYGIKLDPGNVKNKDSCAKVDKAMSELRRELEIISPVERTITTEELCLAISNLNSRIRHSGLSAREIMFQRSQTTNENIPLEDRTLQEATETLRLKNHEYSSRSQSNKTSKVASPAKAVVGNLVYLKNEKEKGSARNLYIVTGIHSDQKLKIRKILHSLEEFPIKLRPEEYMVRQEDVYLAPNQPKLDEKPEVDFDEAQYSKNNPWKPTPSPAPDTFTSGFGLRFNPLEKRPSKSILKPTDRSSESEEDGSDCSTDSDDDISIPPNDNSNPGEAETETPIVEETDNQNDDDTGHRNATHNNVENEHNSDKIGAINSDEEGVQHGNIAVTRTSNEETSENEDHEVSRDSIADNTRDFEDPTNDPDNDEMELTRSLIQNKKPKRGDIIELFSSEQQEWYQVKLYSHQLRGHPFEYNCLFFLMVARAPYALNQVSCGPSYCRIRKKSY